MRALVLSFDRLPSHLLSCLGNEWIETPNFDQLAATARVYEQHYAEIPAPVGPAHPWWTGRFEFFQSAPNSNSIWESRRVANIATQLITERREGLPVELFDQVQEVSGVDGFDAELNQAPFAALIDAALDALSSSHSSQLLWLHSRGVPDPWLPPQFFAELYVDELDDDPLKTIVPQDDDAPPAPVDALSQAALAFLDQVRSDPETAALIFSERLYGSNDDDISDPENSDESAAAESVTSDPETDALLRRLSKFVFGGYVSLLDHHLGRLLAALRTSPEPVVLIVTAAAGQSFGESDAFSTVPATAFAREQLSDAALRTPLFLWSNDPNACGSRHQQFVQPSVIPQLLQQWFQGSGRLQDLNVPPLDHVLHLSPDGAIGYRESRQLLAASSLEALEPEPESAALALYLKPSDAWNLADIAAQTPHEVDRLRELLHVLTRK